MPRLERLEPACVAACADRADRATAVLPFLRANLDAAGDALWTDPAAYMHLVAPVPLGAGANGAATRP